MSFGEGNLHARIEELEAEVERLRGDGHACPLRFREFERDEHQLCIGERCAWWYADSCAVLWTGALVDAIDDLRKELSHEAV